MERAFNSARRACYAGLDSVALRREIVNRISSAVKFDAYAFSTCDPDTSILAHTVADGIPPALARIYVEVLYPMALARRPLDEPRKAGKVFSISDEAPIFASVLRSHGIRDELHVSIASCDRLWGTFCIMRSSAPTASRKYHPFFDRLAPHIARGLQSAALVDKALANDSSRVENAPGVLVLDSANRPSLQTPGTSKWLRDLRDVGLSMPDDIPLSVISLASRLRASRNGGAAEAHVRVRGLSGRWYMVRASLSLPNASGDSSVVVVIRPALPLEVATILTRLYDFSAREREVIAAVARGESTKLIAASLGLSPHTVTEHIDRACYKLGVRGRKTLVAKLFFDGYAPDFREAAT